MSTEELMANKLVFANKYPLELWFDRIIFTLQFRSIMYSNESLLQHTYAMYLVTICGSEGLYCWSAKIQTIFLYQFINICTELNIHNNIL